MAGDLRKFGTELVAAARMAPSLHNAQPWAFRITSDAVRIYADRSRSVRVLDPDSRQMYIGVGAALYAIRLAFDAYVRAEAQVAVVPGADASDEPGTGGLELVAVITAGEERAPSPEVVRLTGQLHRRRTIRERMNPRIPAAAREELTSHATSEGAALWWIWSPADRKTLAHLVTMGESREQADPRIQAELTQWVGGQPVRTGSGLAEQTLGPSAQLSRTADFPARDFAGGRPRLSPDIDAQEAQPTIAILTTRDDHRFDWLRAGQAAMRVMLAATAHGLGASYYNQPLELPDLRARLEHELALPGSAQLVLRFGRPIGGWPVPTPRRPLDDLLL